MPLLGTLGTLSSKAYGMFSADQQVGFSFVGSSTATTNNTNVTMPLTSGVQAGDFMIMVLSSGNGNAVTPPAGWNELDSPFTSGSWQMFVYMKIATGSEPSAEIWGTTNVISAVQCVYRKQSGSITYTWGSGWVSKLSGSYTDITLNYGAAIPGNTPCIALMFASFDTVNGVAGTWADASGVFTKRVDYKGSPRPDIAVFDLLNTTPNSSNQSGVLSWTGQAQNVVGKRLVLT